MNEIDARLKKLDELIGIQQANGTWDYNEYMYGMLIGMLCSRSVFSDADPEYPDPPDKWIVDLDTLNKFNKSGAVLHELHFRGHRRSTSTREDAPVPTQSANQQIEVNGS